MFYRTSYSLPGHVVLSFLALPTPGRLREITELKVMFEGKSEYWDDKGQLAHSAVLSDRSKLNISSRPILSTPSVVSYPRPYPSRQTHPHTIT